jgi:hypothetical protein
MSTTAFGFQIERFGDALGFLAAGVTAAAAVLVVLMLLPETKPAKYDD